jgi:hypothetical protein
LAKRGVVPWVFKWSEATEQWEVIGEMLQNPAGGGGGGAGDIPALPNGKIPLDGKEYDVVFPIELDEEMKLFVQRNLSHLYSISISF